LQSGPGSGPGTSGLLMPEDPGEGEEKMQVNDKGQHKYFKELKRYTAVSCDTVKGRSGPPLSIASFSGPSAIPFSV
jgi:hypothetical protein